MLLFFSHSILPDYLPPHGLHHIRLPCISLSPRVCSNSCLFSRWCHPTISYSVIPFSFCLKSFPTSGSFPVNWFFASGGQRIGASGSASVLLMNIQGWFPLGWTGLIFLHTKRLSRVFSNTTVQKHQFFSTLPSLKVQLSHLYKTTGKTIALTIWTIVSKVVFLLFNMLSRFVISFLPMNNHLLISLLQSPTAVILEPKKIKSVFLFPLFPPSICHEVHWQAGFSLLVPPRKSTCITSVWHSGKLNVFMIYELIACTILRRQFLSFNTLEVNAIYFCIYNVTSGCLRDTSGVLRKTNSWMNVP